MQTERSHLKFEIDYLERKISVRSTKQEKLIKAKTLLLLQYISVFVECVAYNDVIRSRPFSLVNCMA